MNLITLMQEVVSPEVLRFGAMTFGVIAGGLTLSAFLKRRYKAKRRWDTVNQLENLIHWLGFLLALLLTGAFFTLVIALMKSIALV